MDKQKAWHTILSFLLCVVALAAGPALAGEPQAAAKAQPQSG